jgi:hypothetical protein
VTGSCEHVSLVPMLRISGATLLPPMCIHGMETDNFIVARARREGGGVAM